MMNNSSKGTSLPTNSADLQGLAKTDYVKIAAYCLVIILSLFGNSLVIAVIYKNANKRMRTPSNYFVVNMAVGDGLITIVNMVAQVIVLTYGSSLPFGGVAENTLSCKIQNFMWIFLISWSTGSLSAIAVDRFLLVFFPLKRIITLRIARVVIVTILIVGAVISWPLLIFSTLVEYGDITLCTVNMSTFAALRLYYIFIFVAFVFFPLLTLLILYTAIGIKMWLRKSPGNQEARERMNRKIVLMLVTIVVLFALCWMPVASLYFGCFAYPSSETCSILMKSDALFTLWFVAYSNSAINPYVYFIFNENFRHGARMIWSSIRSRVLGSFNSHNQVCASIEMNSITVNDCAQKQTINEETIQREAGKLQPNSFYRDPLNSPVRAGNR